MEADDAGEWLSALAASIETGKSTTFLMPIFGMTGWAYRRWRITKLDDDHVICEGTTGSLQETTREMYRRRAEKTGVRFTVVSKKYGIVEHIVSENADYILPKSCVDTCNYLQLFHPDDAAQAVKEALGVFQTGKPRKLEVRAYGPKYKGTIACRFLPLDDDLLIIEGATLNRIEYDGSEDYRPPNCKACEHGKKSAKSIFS